MACWIAASALLMSVGSACAEVLDAVLIEDVYIESNNPDSTFNSTSVYLGRNAGTVTRIGFLQWRLPKLPGPNHEVVAATLRGRQIASNDSGTLQMGHLATNPALTGLTWNATSNMNIHAGRDANYAAIWGPRTTIWAGEEWPNPGVTQFVWTAYTDDTPNNGMLYFLRERISATSSTIVTFVSGPYTPGGDCQRRIYTSEKNAAPPDGPWKATLSLTVKEKASHGVAVIIR